MIELEPAGEDEGQVSTVREASMALQQTSRVTEVAAQAARWVRDLTGFDRVMVYRFDDEWNGEVIAEAKLDSLNTFLGLHYPSTDIPAQARGCTGATGCGSSPTSTTCPCRWSRPWPTTPPGRWT